MNLKRYYNESVEPSGDWRSWGSITSGEKDRLVLALKKYQEYVKRIYVANLSSPKVYLAQKSINNFDTTDPRFAAKPLSQLSMEDRLLLMQFVDQEDTTGLASRALDFLMSISRNLTENVENIITISKEEENRAVLILKNYKIDRIPVGKTLKKIDHTPPTKDSFDSIYYESIINGKKYLFQIYKGDRGLGLAIRNITSDRLIYTQAGEEINKRFRLTENEERAILTKRDEARAVLFISNITDSGVRMGKTLRKINVYSSDDTPGISDMAFYGAKLANGEPITFKVFYSLRRGLVIVDQLNFFEYRPDDKSKILNTKPSYNSLKYEPGILKENSSMKPIDPNIRISNKEEQQAVIIMGNFKDKYGNRFGKTLRKSYDGANHFTGEHVMRYISDTQEGRMVFALMKTSDGLIRIVSGYGSLMKSFRST